MSLVRISTIEAQILSGADSGEVEFFWPDAGIVMAVSIDVTSGDLEDRAGLGLAFVRGDGYEFVADDFGRQFLPGAQIGGADAAAVDWMLLALPVVPFERWVLQLRNAGPRTVTPRVIFDVAYRGERVNL